MGAGLFNLSVVFEFVGEPAPRIFAESALKNIKKSPIWGDLIQRYYIALVSGIKHLSESQPAGPESIISPKS